MIKFAVQISLKAIINTPVLLLFCLIATAVSSQTIKVEAVLLNERGAAVPGAMVMNLRTYSGSFASSNGTISVNAQKADTLVIGAFGYSSERICFADSVYQDVYSLQVTLKEIRVELGTAEVFAPRELKQIYSDIEELGYQASDYRLSSVNALESPITFLYQAFSKRERSKREVAEMENDDRRRDLLKELFHKYADYDIIALDNHEFDLFIDYLQVSDAMLQGMSQYEFVLYVRDRFKAWQKVRRNMHDSDFDYNQD